MDVIRTGGQQDTVHHGLFSHVAISRMETRSQFCLLEKDFLKYKFLLGPKTFYCTYLVWRITASALSVCMHYYITVYYCITELLHSASTPPTGPPLILPLRLRPLCFYPMTPPPNKNK